MADFVVFTTATEFTTLIMIPESEVPESLATTATSSLMFTSLTTSSPLSFSSMTMSPTHPAPNVPHPSGWPQPTNNISSLSPAIERSSLTKSNTLANIVLAAIILLVVLYLSLFGLAIVTWWKGRCPNCAASENKSRRMEQGQEVGVSKENIQEQEKIRAHRASALANLEINTGQEEGGDHNYRQSPWMVWDRFSKFTRSIGKGKRKVQASTPALPEAGFGTSNSMHLDTTSHPMPAYNPYGRVNRSQSMYSRTSEDLNNSLRGQPINLDDQRNNGEEVFYNNRREVISHFEPYNGAPSPYCRVSWEKPEATLRHLAESRSNLSQLRAADQGVGEARPLAFGMQPYVMESIPLDDPDAERYCNAASLAADLLNPDREDAIQYADRLLRDIRMREGNTQQN